MSSRPASLSTAVATFTPPHGQMPRDPRIAPNGLSGMYRRLAYATVLVGLSMAGIDGSIVNVALPTLSREFGASPATIIWLVNAYQLVMMVSLLPLAAAGESLGYRRVYLSGLALFAVSSIFCACSQSLWTLVAARGVQGFAAACIMSVNIAVVRYIFPRELLGRAIGLNAVIVACAATLGPGIASLVLSISTWPMLFAINVPICIVGLLLGLRTLPYSDRTVRPFDVLSTVQLVATLGLLSGALVSIAHRFDVPVIAGLAFSGACAALMLVRRQHRLAIPLLPVDLLAVPVFRLSICASIAAFCAQIMTFISLPFDFQHRLGLDVSQTGLLLMVWPVAGGLTAPVAGRLADRINTGIMGLVGMVLVAGGLCLIALLRVGSDEFSIAWRLAVCGMGFGFFQSPNNRTMMSSAPLHRSGSASGMLSTARLTGQSIGAAIAALLISQFTHATTVALFVAASFCLFAGFFSSRRKSSIALNI